MAKKLFFSILLYFFFGLFHVGNIYGNQAVNTSYDPLLNIDYPNINNFSHRLSVRPFFFIPLKELTKRHYGSLPRTWTRETFYKINGMLGAGLNISWRIFGITFKAAIPSTNYKESMYGKTSSIDLQLNYYFRKIGFDLLAQYYKSFYIGKPHFNSYNKFGFSAVSRVTKIPH
jgi:hypothetical protein